MLDTGVSRPFINYRTFWEICELQHPFTIEKSTKVTKTYLGQTVPMIDYATKTFSFDRDGLFIFYLQYGSLRRGLRIFLALTSVKNKFLEFILIYLGLKQRTLSNQSALAVSIKTNPSLIYLKF